MECFRWKSLIVLENGSARKTPLSKAEISYETVGVSSSKLKFRKDCQPKKKLTERSFPQSLGKLSEPKRNKDVTLKNCVNQQIRVNN